MLFPSHKPTTLLLFYIAIFVPPYVAAAMCSKALALLLSVSISCALSLDQWSFPGPSYEDLPLKALFPGPWDANIQAPANKTHIKPLEIWNTEGNVVAAEVLVAEMAEQRSLIMGPGGLVTLQFPQNIAGRLVLSYRNII